MPPPRRAAAADDLFIIARGRGSGRAWEEGGARLFMVGAPVAVWLGSRNATQGETTPGDRIGVG
jgi:hypothetical protein